nr:MAG TPA: hypothetical protein [Caudoviricetes sp.]DAZ55418.1 MAG TPA: hypothetical protein [Caudoviricetes sp.]
MTRRENSSRVEGFMSSSRAIVVYKRLVMWFDKGMNKN